MSEEAINLRVVGQEGLEVEFKIKMKTPLKKLTNAYCQRQGVGIDAIRFLYDGERLDIEKTPADLGMTDGDIIDAVLPQTGGQMLIFQ